VVLDSLRPPDVLKEAKRATVGRLVLVSKDMQESKTEFQLIYPQSFDKVVARSQDLTRHVVKNDDSIFPIATAYTWAERMQFLINAANIECMYGLKAVAHLYDCHLILGLEVGEARDQAERFCNTQKLLYFAARPRNEKEWKESYHRTIVSWDKQTMQRRFGNFVREENFVAQALLHNHQTPRDLGFRMPANSEAWWSAVQDRARADLVPATLSARQIWKKVSADHAEITLTTVLSLVATLEWGRQRDVVLEQLNKIPWNNAWFA
jgi:hypothetical protein